MIFSHGIQWNSPLNFPWNSMKFSMEFHGIEFYETEVDGIPWNSMEFHGNGI
jgi:hypothetical protein